MIANQEEINQLIQWVFDEYVNAVKENEGKEIKNTYSPFQIELALPIESIDGVKLQKVSLRIFKHCIDMLLQINNHEYDNSIIWLCGTLCQDLIKIPTSKEGPDVYFAKHNIRSAIEKLFENITKYRFDRNMGHFVLHEVKPLPLKAMYKLASIGAAKTSQTWKECCVCYETTKTHFSKCNHTLCGKCVSNMSCDHHGKLKCPMCRAKILTNDEADWQREQEEAEESDEE